MITRFKVLSVFFVYAKFSMLIKICYELLLAFLPVINIWAIKNLVNQLQQGNPWLVWSVIIVIILIIEVSGTLLDNIILINLKRALNRLYPNILNKLTKLEYFVFESKSDSDLIYQQERTPEELVAIFASSLTVLRILISLIGIVIIFTQVSYLLVLAFVFILPLKLYFEIKAFKLMNSLFVSRLPETRKLDYLTRLLSNKHNLAELKLFNATDFILNKWSIKNKKVLDERLKITIYSHRYFALTNLLIFLWIVVLAILLIYYRESNLIDLGVFISLFSSIPIVFNQSKSFSLNFDYLARKSLAINRFFSFLKLPEVKQVLSKKTFSKDLEISIEDLYFKYPNSDEEVLKGINLKIKSDDRIAIVGRNGAGKSTIVKLLTKLYRPTNGKIRINGIDLEDINNHQLKEIFTVLFQDYNNYQFSLRENIAFGDISKLNNDRDLISSLQKSSLSDFFNKIPQGLDVNLGRINNGIDLSSGEWQRLALSRIFLAHDRFSIIDEPTASMDPIAERDLYFNISKVLDNGALIITHRLASAKFCNKILVLESGKIVEEGNHLDLMDKGGLYFEMFTKQSSWYE